MKKKMLNLVFAAMFLSFVVLTVGCRQNPSSEPKYYKRELAQMRKEEARRAAERAEKEGQYMPDRYPWRGANESQSLNCVPCRVYAKGRHISSEIEYLAEVVHGKRKCRIKIRD